MTEFPDMKGFSITNLKYIRRWYLFYCEHFVIGQQPVDQLAESDKTPLIQDIIAIPWSHNIVIIAKCNTIKEALFYGENTQTHNWSRAVLTHQIESGLWGREGKAITNFKTTLPALNLTGLIRP